MCVGRGGWDGEVVDVGAFCTLKVNGESSKMDSVGLAETASRPRGIIAYPNTGGPHRKKNKKQLMQRLKIITSTSSKTGPTGTS